MTPRLMTALTLALLISSVSPALLAAELAVDASDGIALFQLDFPEDDEPLMDSAVGLLEANLIQLRVGTNLNSGYINMVRGSDWVVRNLPVMTDSDYPYSHLSVKFDLGVSEGTDVSTLDAILVYSDTLALSAPSGTPVSITVESASSSQGGLSDSEFPAEGNNSPTTPPSIANIAFSDPTNNRQIFQLDHPNIEAAKNQCFPASVANSLSFLEKTTDLKLPHSNVAGLKGDQSLVGQLDTLMDREVTSRRAGAGTLVNKGIQGKLQYLADNNLHERITTRHWGFFGDQDFSASNGDKTASSKGQGKSLVFDKLVDALDGGEDCELGYYFRTRNGGWGGHAVDLVAAGYIAGQPFMIENSDLNQGSDERGAGRSGFIFSFLSNRPDGYISMNGGSEIMARAMCQKYVPEPVPTGSMLPPPNAFFYIPGAGLNIQQVTDPAGHSCCAEAPPSLVELVIENGLMILRAFTGSTPWLPITLNLNESGGVSGSNTATVAGFGGIQNSVSGQFQEDKLTAKISLGTGGGLPQGLAISYDVTITPKEPWPWLFEEAAPELSPAIRVNGFRGEHIIMAGEPVTVGVSLQPGANTESADWWLVAEAQGSYYSYDVASANWIPGIVPVAATPAMPLGATSLFTFENSLPAGEYRFHFGLDPTPNNTLELETLIYDSITVTVEVP